MIKALTEHPMARVATLTGAVMLTTVGCKPHEARTTPVRELALHVISQYEDNPDAGLIHAHAVDTGEGVAVVRDPKCPDTSLATYHLSNLGNITDGCVTPAEAPILVGGSGYLGQMIPPLAFNHYLHPVNYNVFDSSGRPLVEADLNHAQMMLRFIFHIPGSRRIVNPIPIDDLSAAINALPPGARVTEFRPGLTIYNILGEVAFPAPPSVVVTNDSECKGRTTDLGDWRFTGRRIHPLPVKSETGRLLPAVPTCEVGVFPGFNPKPPETQIPGEHT